MHQRTTSIHDSIVTGNGYQINANLPQTLQYVNDRISIVRPIFEKTIDNRKAKTEYITGHLFAVRKFNLLPKQE